MKLQRNDHRSSTIHEHIRFVTVNSLGLSL